MDCITSPEGEAVVVDRFGRRPIRDTVAPPANVPAAADLPVNNPPPPAWVRQATPRYRELSLALARQRGAVERFRTWGPVGDSGTGYRRPGSGVGRRAVHDLFRSPGPRRHRSAGAARRACHIRGFRVAARPRFCGASRGSSRGMRGISGWRVGRRTTNRRTCTIPAWCYRAMPFFRICRWPNASPMAGVRAVWGRATAPRGRRRRWTGCGWSIWRTAFPMRCRAGRNLGSVSPACW